MSNSARGRTQNRELESCDGNKKKRKEKWRPRGAGGAPSWNFGFCFGPFLDDRRSSVAAPAVNRRRRAAAAAAAASRRRRYFFRRRRRRDANFPRCRLLWFAFDSPRRRSNAFTLIHSKSKFLNSWYPHLNLTEFDWVWLGFPVIYRVVTGFYRVLLGFSGHLLGPYWVLRLFFWV